MLNSLFERANEISEKNVFAIGSPILGEDCSTDYTNNYYSYNL